MRKNARGARTIFFYPLLLTKFGPSSFHTVLWMYSYTAQRLENP